MVFICLAILATAIRMTERAYERTSVRAYDYAGETSDDSGADDGETDWA